MEAPSEFDTTNAARLRRLSWVLGVPIRTTVEVDHDPEKTVRLERYAKELGLEKLSAEMDEQRRLKNLWTDVQKKLLTEAPKETYQYIRSRDQLRKKEQVFAITVFPFIAIVLSGLSAFFLLKWHLVKQVVAVPIMLPILHIANYVNPVSVFIRSLAFRRGAILMVSYWMVVAGYFFTIHDMEYSEDFDLFYRVALIPPAVILVIFCGFKKFWR
jgi:hypothetical protein